MTTNNDPNINSVDLSQLTTMCSICGEFSNGPCDCVKRYGVGGMPVPPEDQSFQCSTVYCGGPPIDRFKIDVTPASVDGTFVVNTNGSTSVGGQLSFQWGDNTWTFSGVDPAAPPVATKTCPECKGKGKVALLFSEETCQKCAGSGQVTA